METIRKTFTELADCSQLDASNHLIVDGNRISVVYFRSGYVPSFYPSEKEWEVRRRIELSTACKCPCIAYQLTGAKKIQQALAKPGILEKYLTQNESETVRQFFAGLWGLEYLSDPDTRAIVDAAIAHPDGFVLKPQREGGGNNLYGNP